MDRSRALREQRTGTGKSVYPTASTAADEAVQPEKARIVLADDHFLIAQTLAVLLAPHFNVVGVVNEGKLVVDAVVRLRPEVVLLDITMPGLSGLDAARMILEQAPSTKIVFLTMHANGLIAKEAFRAGASAFVVKTCAASDLVTAVRVALAGGVYVSPEVEEQEAQRPFEELSKRQITVLRLVAQGCSAKQIAGQLNISSRTAEFHKSSIMGKLRLRSTSQLTRYAIERGLTS